jgi:hypothetical protein
VLKAAVPKICAKAKQFYVASITHRRRQRSSATPVVPVASVVAPPARAPNAPPVPTPARASAPSNSPSGVAKQRVDRNVVVPVPLSGGVKKEKRKARPPFRRGRVIAPSVRPAHAPIPEHNVHPVPVIAPPPAPTRGPIDAHAECLVVLLLYCILKDFF